MRGGKGKRSRAAAVVAGGRVARVRERVRGEDEGERESRE